MMALVTWVRGRWYARVRRLDVKLLWPIIRQGAGGDMRRARLAFAIHCRHTPAWQALSAEDLDRAIAALPLCG